MRGPLSGRRRPIGRAVNLVLVVVLVHCHAALAHPPYRRDRRDVISGSLQKYLSDYGYLPQSDDNGMAGYLRTEDQLRDAIKNLQAFAGIPVTGLVDPATEQLLRTPRCQLPDIINTSLQSRRRRRFILQGQRWNSPNITWSLQTRVPGDLDRGSVRREMHQAFGLWSAPSKLNIREISGDKADILVCFERGNHGDNYKFDGRGNILAHAFFPGSGRGGDVHFDEDELWFLQDSPRSEGTSLLAVAAHEFGHSLGLAHSSVPEALMFPYYRGLSTGFVLPDDDRLAIQSLYGPREDRQWADNPHYPRTSTVAPPTPRQPRPTPRTSPASPTSPRTPYKPYPPYSPGGGGNDVPGSTPTVRPPSRRPVEEPTNPEAPRTCDTGYDAVSLIRKDLFMFKGRYLWRVDDRGLQPGYPAEITRQWKELPRNFTKIDDVYERNDKKIVFFIGRSYYVFSADTLDRGYPRPLTDLGLPASLTHVDAVMVWGHNSKTYIFSGSQYWKLDDETGKVELDYPRDMSLWKGVGSNIDSVFQGQDGVTYFFKGKGYWKFNDLRMKVAHQKPKPSSDWLGCPKKAPDQNEDDNTFGPEWGRKIRYDDSITADEGVNEGDTASSLRSSLLCQILSVVLLIYFS